MNWFLKHITAQIWETQQDSFVEALEAFYELEYKMQALERWKFKGLPQRKENILNNLRKNLLITANSLKNTLSIVFKEWLSHHAITNPEEWAFKRMDPWGYESAHEYIQAIGEKNALEDAISEYARYENNGKYVVPLNHERKFSEMMGIALSQPQKFLSLQNLIDSYSTEEKNGHYDDLLNEGFENFGIGVRNEAFKSEEEAEQWIENQNFDISDHIHEIEINRFIEILQYLGVPFDVFLQNLNQHLVFPLWYAYWSERGIDETRENVENIYNELINSNDVKSIHVSVLRAIETSHQNGYMMDYLESYGNDDSIHSDVKDSLDSLTDGIRNLEWDKELEQIGVVIPKIVKEDNLKRIHILNNRI